jgi:hypothetical protein
MSKQIGKSVIDKQKLKKRKQKKKNSEQIFLRIFLLFAVTLLNILTGAKSLLDMNEIYKKVKKDIPDSSKSKQTIDAMKDITKIVAKQHKADVFSIILIAHSVIERVKQAYIVAVGRDKLTIHELKMLNREALMTNVISNLSNYFMKKKMLPWSS